MSDPAGPDTNSDADRTARDRPSDTVTVIAVANVALVGIPAAYATTHSAAVTAVAATAAVALASLQVLTRKR